MDINSERIKSIINEFSNSIRAERNEVDSFLELYAQEDIIGRLTNKNNQIIYGRRGSGKTHLLLALSEQLYKNNAFSNKKAIPIYIDLRTLLPMLTDFDTSKIETSILIFKYLINHLLDELIKELRYILEIDEVGTKSIFEKIKRDELNSILNNLNYEFDGRTIKKLGSIDFTKEELKKISGSLELSKNPNAKASNTEELKQSYSDSYIKYISFRDISKNLIELTNCLHNVSIYFLIDEWSELPIKLQPYLSELLKRSFVASEFTLKIAAIPYRSKFREYYSNENKLGLEEGGDIFSVPLDNRYVFEIDKIQTRDFYNELLYKHLNKIDSDYFKDVDKSKFINEFFANQALSEILIASAGIPRDFINLFIYSYNNRINLNQRIVLKNVRKSTTEWYLSDKKEEIEKDITTKLLFEGIVNEVVIKKNKTHFLIPQKFSNNEHIKKLIDLRVLHIRQKGISHRHIKDKTFDVLSVDYGSYTSLDISKKNLETEFSQIKNDIVTIDNIRDARSLSLNEDFFSQFFLEIGQGKICKNCSKIIDINHPAYLKQKICHHCYESA